MNTQSHAERIRRLRTERGFSRVDLAKEAGISAATVTKIEQGRHVGLSALVRIYSVLAPYTRCIDLV
jgi:transcriptional regulator with XRE-family HTH domain